MKFYGLWTPKGNQQKINDCLNTGVWYRGECPNIDVEKKKFDAIEIDNDVFLYEGVEDVKIANSPLAKLLPPTEYDAESSVVKVKCHSIGKVTAIDIENLTISVNWDKAYSGSEWFTYFRQDGVWLVHNNQTIASALKSIIFDQEKPDYKALAESSYFDQNKIKVVAKSMKSIHQKALNQILYGPPGTGKTYSTVKYALDILGETDNKIESIQELKDRFPKQIEFVTFHQSFSYEDFVEGIKVDKGDNGELDYRVVAGVFKQICEDAKESGNSSLERFDELVENLKAEVMDETKLLKTATGKEFFFSYPGMTTFRVVPKSSGKEFSVDGSNSGYPVSIDSIKELYKNPDHRTYNKSYAKAILSCLDLDKYHESESKKPHILIIDEINRGNISRIFGELITLIEASKRDGKKEAISVQLPYSKLPFSVPQNLHIIGTMNTADRSLALMDTALRRRFDFIEMMPDVDLVKGLFDEVDVRKILVVMNKRIEVIYDREHTIGHAFLMGVNNLAGLRNAFKNKILPLLEEYFYEDWKKIQLVLGDINNQFYEPVTYEEDLFSGMDDDVDMNEIYRRKEVPSDADSYTQIYKDSNGADI